MKIAFDCGEITDCTAAPPEVVAAPRSLQDRTAPSRQEVADGSETIPTMLVPILIRTDAAFGTSNESVAGEEGVLAAGTLTIPSRDVSGTNQLIRTPLAKLLRTLTVAPQLDATAIDRLASPDIVSIQLRRVLRA